MRCSRQAICWVLGCILTTLFFQPATILAKEPPAAVRAVLLRIAPLLENQQYDQAAVQLEAYLAGSSAPHAELFFALGNCHLLQDQHTRAISAYTQAVVLDPDHTSSWLNLAKAHYDRQQYREAAVSFARAYDSTADSQADTLYFSAAAFLMAGANQDAVSSFARLFAAHPTAIQPVWKEHYIHALLNIDQARQALPLIKELIAAYSGEDQVRWQEILLYQYLSLNMQPQALTLARKLTEEYPTEPKWWQALIHIQLQAERLEEALTACIILNYLKPLSAEETRLLADLYLQAGIPAMAAPLYAGQLGTRHSKPDVRLLQHLAHAYNRLGQPQEALAVLADQVISAQDPRLLMLKGELHLVLKQYDQAATAYRQAGTQQGQHQGQAWLMAGHAALQIDDTEGSRMAFSRAAHHDREKKAAVQALAYLDRKSTGADSPL
jgi:tetratricopeptide (TPR) repeat protein